MLDTLMPEWKTVSNVTAETTNLLQMVKDQVMNATNHARETLLKHAVAAGESMFTKMKGSRLQQQQKLQ